MRTNRGRTLGVAAVCVAVGAAGGIVGTMAAPAKKTRSQGARTTPSGAQRPDSDNDERTGPGRMAVHSEEVVLDKAGKSWITETEDSGTIKSIDGSSVTISEGTTAVPYKDVTVDLGGATVVRDGATAKVADLKTGDRIRVSKSSDGTFVFAADANWRPAYGRHGGERGWGGPPGGPPPGAPGDDQ